MALDNPRVGWLTHLNASDYIPLVTHVGPSLVDGWVVVGCCCDWWWWLGKCDCWEIWWSGNGMVGKCDDKGGGGCGGVGGGVGYVNVKWNKIA